MKTKLLILSFFITAFGIFELCVVPKSYAFGHTPMVRYSCSQVQAACQTYGNECGGWFSDEKKCTSLYVTCMSTCVMY